MFDVLFYSVKKKKEKELQYNSEHHDDQKD